MAAVPAAPLAILTATERFAVVCQLAEAAAAPLAQARSLEQAVYAGALAANLEAAADPLLHVLDARFIADAVLHDYLAKVRTLLEALHQFGAALLAHPQHAAELALLAEADLLAFSGWCGWAAALADERAAAAAALAAGRRVEKNSIYACEHCHSHNVLDMRKRTRLGGDEGDTIFLLCQNVRCGKLTKLNE
jgi:hypothetical protein